MELETLIREVLREHAADAPTIVPVLRSSPVRRWLYAGLAAAVVAGLAVGITLVRGSNPIPATLTPPESSSVPQLSTPPGYTRVAYHDFTVAVPDGLPVITSPCVAPARYVFTEDPNVAYSCAARRIDPVPPTLTVRLTSARSTSDEIATEPTEIGGMSARIGYGSLDGFPGVAGEALFAAEDLGVVVTAPDRTTVEHVLTSVRREADPNGCPADFPVPADGAADVLVPREPASALRCVYAETGTGNVLQASLPVHSGALHQLVEAIDGLPLEGTASQRPFETDLLRFAYSDGSVRTVLVELGNPTQYSDGALTGYDDDNVVTDQLRAATS